ncbi:MAG TPA: glycosyltransferase family 39 protein [Paludibacter sp.]|nr:glycosyltransferase family 39 protein [Paludibacter sp.]
MLNYFPKFFTNKAIALYVGALVLVSVVFFKRILPFQWMLFGLVEVIGFFYFSNLFTRKWTRYTPKAYEKKLFRTSLSIRMVWVVFSYLFYLYMTGTPFEFGSADAFFYNSKADSFSHSTFNIPDIVQQLGASDSGYIIYLTIIKKIIPNDIIITRLLKAVLSSITCVFIYRLARRNFGEEVGRMSGVFCMLLPNLIYYTGLHLKETEMVFLTVWCLERSDFVLREKKYNFINIAIPLALAGSLFFFRTILGATALFAFFTAIIFSSTRILGMGKRVLLAIWIFVTVGYFVGGRIDAEMQALWAQKDTNQQNSMEWRSVRENGNKFAKYASGVVFAPMIFVIPLPTMINITTQPNIMLINGGNYVKNVMAFFVIFAVSWIIRKRKWREFTLLGAFTLGYLLTIAVTGFAQSERFHQPTLSFLMIFAAFGISQATNKQKKYFRWWLVFLFVCLIGWSWFKLAGRDVV